MANVRTRSTARTNTSPEKGSDKHNAERYRELKKRYMRILRENARLRKALSVYESLMEPYEIDLTEVPDDPIIEVCPKCNKGTYDELDLGHVLIKTCNSCGNRVKLKVPLIRSE